MNALLSSSSSVSLQRDPCTGSMPPIPIRVRRLRSRRDPLRGPHLAKPPPRLCRHGGGTFTEVAHFNIWQLRKQINDLSLEPWNLQASDLLTGGATQTPEGSGKGTTKPLRAPNKRQTATPEDRRKPKHVGWVVQRHILA